jgi:hypothetical protein
VYILNSFNEIAMKNSQYAPNTYHSWGTGMVNFYENYLMTKAMSVFKWEIPENWNMDYLKNGIFTYGGVAVINTIRFGVIPQYFTPSGYDIYYQPNTAIIANPILGSYELKIGEQCEVIKLKRDWLGITDIIHTYAELLAECDKALGINLINTKASFVFGVDNKTEADKMKKMYDNIQKGEPAVFYKTGGNKWEIFNQNLKNTYLVQDLLIAKKTIMQEFNTLVGVPNANTEKRERLLKDEVNANNGETLSLSSEWLEELKKGCEKVKEMFGINVNVEFRKEVNRNGENNTMGDVE